MDKSMLIGLVSSVVSTTAGGYTTGMSLGAAMMGRLVKSFIQEVPDELSVCEFDCPHHECTVKDWVVCELRNQPSLRGHGIIRSTARMLPVEAPACASSG